MFRRGRNVVEHFPAGNVDLKTTYHMKGYTMNEIIDILTELHDDVDFTTETGLVENGILNSLDIVAIISEIDDRLDVQIPAEEILPENFDSAEALWALVQRLDEA